jgi:hypothetical protein
MQNLFDPLFPGYLRYVNILLLRKTIVGPKLKVDIYSEIHNILPAEYKNITELNVKSYNQSPGLLLEEMSDILSIYEIIKDYNCNCIIYFANSKNLINTIKFAKQKEPDIIIVDNTTGIKMAFDFKNRQSFKTNEESGVIVSISGITEDTMPNILIITKAINSLQKINIKLNRIDYTQKQFIDLVNLTSDFHNAFISMREAVLKSPNDKKLMIDYFLLALAYHKELSQIKNLSPITYINLSIPIYLPHLNTLPNARKILSVLKQLKVEEIAKSHMDLGDTVLSDYQDLYNIIKYDMSKVSGGTIIENFPSIGDVTLLII